MLAAFAVSSSPRLERCEDNIQQCISDLERGRRNPTIVTVYEIAQALGVSHLDLLRVSRASAR